VCILLVEDDDDVREDLSELLRGEGYPVATASNGKDALAQLEAGCRPRLIILDLMMPVMDGWQLRAALLRHREWSQIPVLVFSGAGDVRQHAADLSADGYVAKPVDWPRTVSAYC
jgi:CheY-like chemotaxis protein